MLGFKKRVARMALRNADKIDAALDISDPIKRAEELLDIKKKIKSSYRPLSLRLAVETALSNTLSVVAFLPVTALFTAAAIATDALTFEDTTSTLADKLDDISSAPRNYRTGVASLRQRKNKDRAALLGKSDAELSSVYAQEPKAFAKIPAIAKILEKPGSKGELSAIFGFSAYRKQEADTNYSLLRSLAIRTLRPAY